MPKSSDENFVVVMVTAPSLTIARKLARTALKERLIACANLVPQIESHYVWKGKVQTAQEILAIMKTSGKNLAALEKLILSNHPYETPKFIALPIKSGSADYLSWLKKNVR